MKISRNCLLSLNLLFHFRVEHKNIDFCRLTSTFIIICRYIQNVLNWNFVAYSRKNYPPSFET